MIQHMCIWSCCLGLSHCCCEFRGAGADQGKRHGLFHQVAENTTGFLLGCFEGFGGKDSPSQPEADGGRGTTSKYRGVREHPEERGLKGAHMSR